MFSLAHEINKLKVTKKIKLEIPAYSLKQISNP